MKINLELELDTMTKYYAFKTLMVVGIPCGLAIVAMGIGEFFSCRQSVMCGLGAIAYGLAGILASVYALANIEKPNGREE